MKEFLPDGQFPPPGQLDDFLKWDDWRVLGLLADGKGGEHGSRLARRDHYRVVFQTNEVQTLDDKAKLAKVRESLGGLLAAEMPAAKSWYKTGQTDIRVESAGKSVPTPLSILSSVVRNIGTNDQVLLYSSPENRSKALEKVKEALNGME